THHRGELSEYCCWAPDGRPRKGNERPVITSFGVMLIGHGSQTRGADTGRPLFLPRRRNLWVTDTLQWAPEARLAQPANPMWDSAASAFPVRSQLPFELVCPPGKRYAVKLDQSGRNPSSSPFTLTLRNDIPRILGR